MRTRPWKNPETCWAKGVELQGGCRLPAKEHLRHQNLGEKHGTDSPSLSLTTLKRNQPWGHLDFRLEPPELWDNTFLLSKKKEGGRRRRRIHLQTQKSTNYQRKRNNGCSELGGRGMLDLSEMTKVFYSLTHSGVCSCQNSPNGGLWVCVFHWM